MNSTLAVIIFLENKPFSGHCNSSEQYRLPYQRQYIGPDRVVDAHEIDPRRAESKKITNTVILGCFSFNYEINLVNQCMLLGTI